MIEVQNAWQLQDFSNSNHSCPLRRSVSAQMQAAFIDISQDHSAIHHPSSATAIVPGNLLISLLPAMLQSALVVQQYKQCKTVALAKVRYYHSVCIDEVLQLEFSVLKVRRLKDQTFVTTALRLKSANTDDIILTAEQIDCYEE